MKTLLALLLVSSVCIASVRGQGSVMVDPVPVTNVLTGNPADNSFSAGLYYGLGAVTENSLVLAGSYSPLSGGNAFDSSPTISIPGYSGGSITFQVRAASSGYSYETAIASGNSSVLAGKSGLLTFPSIGPGTQTLTFAGFTIQPVPEPSTAAMAVAGIAVWRLRRRNPASVV
jgi:hypothetical protein